MSPEESAPGTPRPASSEAHADRAGEIAGGGPLVLMVLAVGFAVIGLVSLTAILVSAFFQWTVWPGFVLASYFCLPLAFLLMVVLVLRAAIGRRRT